jgi:hypothetical protein
MIIIHADGSKGLLDKNGVEHPYRWWNALSDKISSWRHSSDWRSKQAVFQKQGTRYYGDGGTIHHSIGVDVEISKSGEVVSVWFRCQPLPFQSTVVDDIRVDEMRKMYVGLNCELHGVEIKDA